MFAAVLSVLTITHPRHLECCRHLLAARADPRVPDAPEAKGKQKDQCASESLDIVLVFKATVSPRYGGMSAQMHALSKARCHLAYAKLILGSSFAPGG